MSGRGNISQKALERRKAEIAIILRETGGVQADKRLVAFYADSKLQPQHIRHLLAFRKHLTAVCLRKGNAGRATRRQLAEDMGMNRSTLGRKLDQLLVIHPGPSGPDYWEDGDEFVIDGFDRAFWAPHRKRQEAKRSAWRAKARRQRGTLCASTPLESAEKRHTGHLSEMSLELIYAGSKKIETPPSKTTVVTSTRVTPPAAEPAGWQGIDYSDPLFAGLQGLAGRALLDAVAAREREQQARPQAGEISQSAAEELADVAWWRSQLAARMPSLDPRYLKTANVTRRCLTAAVAWVLMKPDDTRLCPGKRALGLARSMQRNQLITPQAASAARTLGTRYEKTSRKNLPAAWQ